MRFVKQSTSVNLPIGPFLDDTDGKTAETSLTLTQPDVRLKKNGADWAQKAAAQTLTHEENGNYEVTLDATDTDTLGHLRLHVAESGALPVWEDFMVLPANVYDSLVGGSDNLQVDAVQFAGQTITAGAGVTMPATVASTTNITAGTITTVTNLTNAATSGDLTSTMKTSVTSAVPTVSEIWTTALTEAYRATGATGTAAELLHEILQNITEFSISGTTKTAKKFDHSTTAKTYTLNSATAPTSITEAT